MERLIKSASAGDAVALGYHAAVLMRALLAALRSPLAAPRAAQLILGLRPSFWPDDVQTMGDLIAHVTLR